MWKTLWCLWGLFPCAVERERGSFQFLDKWNDHGSLSWTKWAARDLWGLNDRNGALCQITHGPEWGITELLWQKYFFWELPCAFYIYNYQTLLSKGTYSTFRLYICIVSMCVLWELNPQPLHCQHNALTTEPHEHFLLVELVFAG